MSTIVISILQQMIKNIMIPALSELIDTYSKKGENYQFTFDDYISLVDKLEKVATETQDPQQAEQLMKWANFWKEHSQDLAYEQLTELRDKADKHLSLGEIEDAIECYNKATLLGEIVGYLSFTGNIANSLARHYLENMDYENAVKWFEKVVEINPEDLDAFLGLAFSFGNSGRLEEAVEISNQACQVYDYIVYPWYNKGYYLLQLNRNEKALEAFEKGIMIDENYSPFWYAKAEIYLKIGEAKKSISSFEKYLDLEPDDADGWNGIGNVYYNILRDYEEAEKFYRKGLEIDKNNQQVIYNLGLIHKQRGNLQQSIENFNKATDIDPFYTAAWIQKGLLYLQIGNFEEASKSFKEATGLDPGLEQMWFGLGYSLYEIDQFEEALLAYEHATELEPDNEEAWFNKALCLQQLERYEEAIGIFKKVIDLKQDYFQAYRNLVRLLERTGEYEEAVAYLEGLIDIEKKDPDLWNWKGNIHHDNLKQYQKAIECYKKVLESDDQHHTALYNMGNSYSELDENDKAIEAYKKATETKPDYRDAWYKKGRTEQKLKRFDESLKSFQQVVTINPEDFSSWFGIGFSHHELGNYNDAINAYEKVLKILGDDAATLENIGVSYIMLEKYDDAFEAAERALKHDPKSIVALNNKAFILFNHFHKSRKAYDCYQQAIELDPNNLAVAVNIPEVLMALEKYKEARIKAEEGLMNEMDTHQTCWMRFIIFATLLYEDRENEAWDELQEIMQFFSSDFHMKKAGWNFEGMRYFFNASASRHKHLILKLLDLFERKIKLTEFRKEAKRHFQLQD